MKYKLRTNAVSAQVTDTSDNLILTISPSLPLSAAGSLGLRLVDLLNADESMSGSLAAKDAIDTLERMSDPNRGARYKGRAGANYGDTEFDSLSVVHGYDEAMNHVREILQKYHLIP